MSREAKYRLAFNPPGAQGSGAQSGGDFRTLAGALAAALVMNDSGMTLIGVTCGGLPVMNGEELNEAVGRLRTLVGECSGDNMIVCAGRVLREMNLE